MESKYGYSDFLKYNHEQSVRFQNAGDSMVRQSVALVKVKDPFLKRSGASRLTLIATDGEFPS